MNIENLRKPNIDGGQDRLKLQRGRFWLMKEREKKPHTAEMDYSLAALKLLCGQLKDARGTPSQSALTLGGILFQRVWLQGVLVSNDDEDRLLLDDSTGIVELNLSGDFRQRQWKTGMYVMVVGGYFVRTGDIPVIKVHKIVDLSPFPDREAMWYLEVLEAYKLFYQPLIEEFI